MLRGPTRILRSSLAADGATAARGADARTLYLQEATCQRVDASDDALVVTVQRNGEKARQMRFPLERVARIVSSTALDWSGAALQLCLQRHLSICWLSGRGDALGSLYSHRPHALPFASALDLLLETDAGLARYAHWHRSRRMHVQLQWGRLSEQDIAPQAWEACKRHWVYQAQIDAHLPPRLNGLLAAVVAQQLQKDGLAPVHAGPAGTSVPLADDLVCLLWAEMNLCTGPLADQIDGGEELALVLERWQSRNGSALLLHLSSLQRLAGKEIYA